MLRAQALSSASINADGGTPSDKPSLDIQGLVRESDLHGALMHKSLGDYTYNLVKIKRTLNEQGRVLREQVQSFEAYPVQGQHVLIQTAENGIALSLRDLAEERRRAGEELSKAEREAEKRQVETEKRQASAATAATDDPGRYLLAGVFVSLGGKSTNVLIDLSEFLRTCEFSAPRREPVGTREAIALSFHPRAGIKFQDQVSFISKLNGTVWIDAADKVVVRLEGWPVTKPAEGENSAHQAQGAKPPEAAIIYQQVRLSTGVWVPSLIRMNAGGNPALFNGLNWDVIFQFSDYKHFITDIEGVELGKPKRQP
jgi:hypothetical protein